MSKVIFNEPVAEMHGKLGKDAAVIMRQKSYRLPGGGVYKVGPQESYVLANPRDYKKNPPKGKEQENIDLFRESKRLTSLIIHADCYSDEQLAAMDKEQRTRILELRAELDEFKSRFVAQLKTPDKEAPLEKQPAPGSSKVRRKQYCRLDNFIQAVIWQRLKK